MEELKKRLSFDDITIRSRCLQKLVQNVKRKSRGELITSSSVQIPDLNLIWETCMNDSVTTSNLAVQAIIHLATNHHLDVNYSINKLISSLSSTNNAYGIVKGLSKLLIYENNQSENGRMHYSMHKQRHPLIAVLQSNDDYLPLIFESIADAIGENNLRGFQVMEPVICYILSNPAKKRNDYSKTFLLETLIDTVKNEPKTAFYILRCIPFLQVEDYQQVSETSNFILNAKRTFANFQCEESDRIYISELLLLSSLSLCDRSLDVGFDPVRLFAVAMDSCLFLSQLHYTSVYINACLILVSMILKKSFGKIIENSASLALQLLDFSEISPTVAAFLAFSVIQLLPEPSVISFGDSTNSILSHLLEKLEKILKQQDNVVNASDTAMENAFSSEVHKQNENDNVMCIEAFTFTVESSMLCAKFASKLDESSLGFKLNWLESIRTSIQSGTVENLDVIFSLVAALFLMSSDDQDYLNSCLDTFEAILLKNSYLSTKIFALLLYKQNLLKSSESKLLILEFLPKSATHKHSIPPVLSIFKMMSNIVDLKPQAIHLMLQLWKKHDRCFSYLHKLLVENNKVISADLGVSESLISQTAAIREICQIAPEKRGVEFLGILSKVINESNDEATSAAACLALDGVVHLCKSEITDLRSTWKVLGPRLTKDKRTVVMCRMFKLLSLVPDFPVKSPEFDKFMSDIVALIWKRISSGIMPPEAVCCAYQTLSKFPMDSHVLKQLPSPAKENLQLPASMKTTPFEMSKSPEDVLTYIPGYCFIDLLKSLDNDVVKDYTEFLNSAIKQEVADLPRSMYSQRKHLQKRQNANEALSKVPKVLCSLFEARRSLTLQRNLAVGVLLSYEPPLEMGKDGEPIKRSVASQCRFYEQVLGVLLNEVNIDTTEWQRCILLPSAWAGFMERAFIACEESRRAELELQRNLGHKEFTPEEFNLQCKSTWLWVRDRLLNLLKTCVKNAATSHANAMFAVSGLVRATSKFRATLDDATKTCSDENSNHVLHQIFEEECTETILCAMMPDYQPNGKVHSWLLTHLSRPNSSTAFLVRGCSCSALSHLAPVLSSTHVGKIPELFKELVRNLFHSSPVLSFYSGVGLGLLAKSLLDDGYADAGESQMGLLMDTAKQLQKTYLNEDDPPSSVLVSLTMMMAALSRIDHEDCKDWISTTCNIFHEKLNEEEISSMNFEALSICVSAMIISAAEGGCIPVDSVLSLASWFEERQSEQPQCSGISVSCGMLIEALERFGHSQGVEIRQNLQKIWFSTLSSEKKNTLHRIAALNGLCSLYSCGRGLLQAKNKEENSNSSAVNDLVSLMFQMLNAERDTGLQNICSWEVGRLFSVHCFQKETDVSVPLSYSYLGEKSVLKPLLMMINNSQKADQSECKPYHLLACLEAIGGVFPRPLPPLNWAAVLTPFLEQNTDPSLVYASLNVSIYHANGSSYATNLLASYSCPPLFHTLPKNCQLLLFQNIPGLVSVLPPHKLKVFLYTITSIALKQDKDPQSLCGITLQGIQDAFKLPGVKQQTLNVVQNTFLHIFKQFKKDLKLVRKHLKWILDMLSCLPEKKMESLLSVSNDSNELSAVTVLLGFLVRMGNKPLTSLRPCIEEGKHASLLDKEQIYATLYECFLPCENEKSEINQPEKCISWLLQIIGWINVLNDSKSKYQLMTVGDVFLFLNDVCAATIIGCSGLECSYNLYPVQNLSHRVLLENLPIAISKLCTHEKWGKVTNKIIAWLMMVIHSPHITESDKNFMKLSLCAVRGTSEFQELDIWTDVVSSIY